MSKEISKRLSCVLRLRPDSIGIALDAPGWVAIDALLAALAASGTPPSRAALERVVATDDKQRLAVNADGSMIRAVQGHSTKRQLDASAPAAAGRPFSSSGPATCAATATPSSAPTTAPG
jgi:putative RNA 2'-phosphotransferase